VTVVAFTTTDIGRRFPAPPHQPAEKLEPGPGNAIGDVGSPKHHPGPDQGWDVAVSLDHEQPRDTVEDHE